MRTDNENLDELCDKIDGLINGITNKHGLPEEVYRALCKKRYSGDDESGKVTDYSVTTLISPIQQVILRKRHPNCNAEDAIDRVWSLFGHIAHSLLEEHGSDDALTEKRFYATVHPDTDVERVLSGQVDHYRDGIITDYKTTSVYKIQKKSYDDWEKQLNVYAWLCRRNDLPVRNLRIIAIIRDWQESRADIPDYPSTPIVEIPLTVWSNEDAAAFVSKTMGMLYFNEKQPDDALMPCSKDDRWMGDSKWAVMKKDAKRATKVFDNEKEAYDFQLDSGDDYVLVERCGEPRRCLKYCNVSSVCVQHREYLKGVTGG